MTLRERDPNFQNTGDIDMNVCLSDTGTRFKAIGCALRVLMRARVCVHTVACRVWVASRSDMIKAGCVTRNMNLSCRRVLYKSSGPLGEISASGSRHGNDDTGARTADPSASRRDALRHGNDDAAVEMTTPDDEFLLQNYRTIYHSILRPRW